MTDCMYENIRVAAMINKKRISEQNLKIIQQKYGIDDMDGCLAFCRQENIEVYDEEKEMEALDLSDQKQEETEEETEEERHQKELGRIIAQRVVHLSLVRSMRKANRIGAKAWICGTYTSKVTGTLCRKVMRIFTVEEMEFIVSHLGEGNKDDIVFHITDDLKKDECDIINAKLNKLILPLHINYYIVEE